MAEYNLPYPPLCGRKNDGFAYTTLKDRLPVILTQVIDTAHRQRQNIFTCHGEAGSGDLKSLIGELSELRYRLVTNKSIAQFPEDVTDAEMWNKAWEELKSQEGCDPSWFNSPWLFVECFMYRRVNHIFASSKFFTEWDVFCFQKEQSFVGALPAMTTLANDLLLMKNSHPSLCIEEKRTSLRNLTWICLWGNRCDLSISSGQQYSQDISNPMSQLEELKQYILHDDSYRLVTEHFLAGEHGKSLERIDFILDNAGLELFSDLCLAELLIEINAVKLVVFHVKSIPWFVSDTTSTDFSWTFEMLQSSAVDCLKDLGMKLQSRVDCGEFKVETDPFWTGPYSFCHMQRVAPALYNNLSGSNLVILKGDLNYRKLTGDLAWPCDTTFKDALRGFAPCPLVSLRTVKADTIVGVENERVKQVQTDTKTTFEWMTTGQYAVVQMHP